MFSALLDSLVNALPISFAGDSLVVRAGLVGSVALLLSLVLGAIWVRSVGRRLGEPIRSGSDEVRRLHRHKKATPTMGGLFVVVSLLIAVVLGVGIANRLVQIGLFLTVGLTGLGALDDVTKLFGKRNGLSRRAKFWGQTAIAFATAWMLYGYLQTTLGSVELTIPGFDWRMPLGLAFVPWATLVLVGASNSVNLTDGLDGLAGGCLVWTTGAIGLIALALGDSTWAARLGIDPLPTAAEAGLLASALGGAVLGFLWFNRHPARVFMGDTGSLPLGGLLGLVALAIRQELLLLVVGGVFVVETLSVILQIGSCRLRGRRVFRCAPLHHHFQFLGWSERKIVRRFWLASAACALLGIVWLGTRNFTIEINGPFATLLGNYRD